MNLRIYFFETSRRNFALLAFVSVIAFTGWAHAHCDTLDGPIVAAARDALNTGNVTPVLKWVRAVDEPEIRAAFARSMAVRSKGADARELADLYFFETVVRVHRAGEGEPYTGLKSAGEGVSALVKRGIERSRVAQRKSSRTWRRATSRQSCTRFF